MEELKSQGMRNANQVTLHIMSRLSGKYLWLFCLTVEWCRHFFLEAQLGAWLQFYIATSFKHYSHGIHESSALVMLAYSLMRKHLPNLCCFNYISVKTWQYLTVFVLAELMWQVIAPWENYLEASLTYRYLYFYYFGLFCSPWERRVFSLH